MTNEFAVVILFIHLSSKTDIGNIFFVGKTMLISTQVWEAWEYVEYIKGKIH